MTVWIEYAFLQNYIVDITLLYATLKCLRLKIIPMRLVFSALLGTIFAIIYPLLSLPSVLSIIVKILFGVIMLLLCIECKQAKYYLLAVMLFYLFTFAYGGVLIAISFIGKLEYTQGYYLVAETPVGLLFALLPVFAVVLCLLFYRLYQNFNRQKLIFECSIGEEEQRIKALLDTGNGLYYIGKPVCVLDKKIASTMNVYSKVIGYISVKTATGNGILSIFSSSLKIYSDGEKNIIDKVYFAISPTPLDGEYGLILHTALFS